MAANVSNNGTDITIIINPWISPIEKPEKIRFDALLLQMTFPISHGK